MPKRQLGWCEARKWCRTIDNKTCGHAGRRRSSCSSFYVGARLQVIAQTCKQNLLLNITGNKNQSLTDGSEMHAPYAPGQNCSWVLQAPVGKRAVLKFIRFNTKVGCANVTLYHGMESAEGEGEGEGASFAGKGFSQGYENRRLQHQKLAGP